MSGNVLSQAAKTVMLVAVFGVAAHQTASAQAAPCTSFKKSATAQISTAGDIAKVEPDRLCVTGGAKITWTAADGDTWGTDFADDTHSPFSPGKRHHEGKVRKNVGDHVRHCSTSDQNYDANAGGCVFKYKAAHVKDGKTSVIDPDVVIKPGT